MVFGRCSIAVIITLHISDAIRWLTWTLPYKVISVLCLTT